MITKRQEQIKNALEVLNHAIEYLDDYYRSHVIEYLDGYYLSERDAIRILNCLYCELHAESRAIERESEVDEMEY